MGFNVPSSNQIVRHQPVNPEVWVRQPDWVSITGVSDGQVLFLVSNATNSTYRIATESTGGGNIYINWGDGNVSTISSSARTNTEYVYTSGGTPCSLGYNTWKVTVSADTGTRITFCSIVAYANDFPKDPSGLLEAWYGDNTLTTSGRLFDDANDYPYFTYLEYVKLPNGMTGTDCFDRTFATGCRNLKKVDMPTSCPNNQLMDRTFLDCANLLEVSDLPTDMTGVTTCYQAFFGCSSLQRIVYPSIFPNCTTIAQVHQNNYALGECILPSLPSCTIYLNAFNSCGALISMQIRSLPSNATVNMSTTFRYCDGLKNISFPNNVDNTTKLDIVGAFEGCGSLQTLILPPNAKLTGSLNLTFSTCVALVYLSLPNDASEVNNFTSAFASCRSLQTITMPSIAPTSLASFSATFQNCASLNEVIIPSGYTISTLLNCFSGCRSLVNVELPQTSQNITSLASSFQNCSKLKTVTLPTGLPSANTMLNMFNGCSDLQSVTFPASMPGVATMQQAFQDCLELVSVTLPTTISAANTNCWLSTFRNCRKIENIVLPATLSSPATATSLATAFIDCVGLLNITFPTTQMTGINTVSNMISGCLMLTGLTNSSYIGNNSTATTTYVNGSVMATGSRNLKSLSFNCKFSKLEVQGTSGAASNLSDLASLRLLNNGSGQYGGTSPQINVSYTSMSAAALDQLFTDLPTVTAKTINIAGCPGTATCNQAIATAKGWTVATV
jgi:hypothetical protein